MASFPPKKNAAYTFDVVLTDRTTGQIKTTPTLATGDVKISKDGGALANVGTLPAETPASSGIVAVVLTSTEMNADRVTILFRDASGAEWNDVACTIETSVRQVDDLAFPNTSGRGMDVDASGGVEVGSFQTGAITAAAHAAGAIDAAALATDAAQEIADALLDRSAGVETNRTVRQALRLMLAALAGKASGMGTTTATIRDTNDSKDRIVATVDASGNRSAVTLDAT